MISKERRMKHFIYYDTDSVCEESEIEESTETSSNDTFGFKDRVSSNDTDLCKYLLI